MSGVIYKGKVMLVVKHSCNGAQADGPVLPPAYFSLSGEQVEQR